VCSSDLKYVKGHITLMVALSFLILTVYILGTGLNLSAIYGFVAPTRAIPIYHNNANWTGSVLIVPQIMQLVHSKTQINLTQAVSNAVKSVVVGTEYFPTQKGVVYSSSCDPNIQSCPTPSSRECDPNIQSCPTPSSRECDPNIQSCGGGNYQLPSSDSASLVVIKGYLVYSVIVLDAANFLHRVIVDADNGKVLSDTPASPFVIPINNTMAYNTNSTISQTNSNIK